MGLRDFMNQRRRNPHYYVVDERGYVYCTDGAYWPNSLVGDAGMKPKQWKTQRGAEAFAKGSNRPLQVKFSEFDP